MKKLAIAIALVLLVGAFAMALDATVTGSATSTWGYDLQNNKSGFTNAATATITVPLVAQTSDEKTGDAMYGYIKLGDFAASVTGSGLSVTAPSVTAKLLLSDAAWVKIFSAPSYKIGNAKGFAHLSDVIAGNSDTELNAVDPDLSGYTGGLTFGYDMAIAKITVDVTSNGDWDGADAGTDMSTDGKVYVAGADNVDIDSDDTATYYGVGKDQGSVPWTAGGTIPAGTTYIKVSAPSAAVAANANKYSAGFGVTLTPMDMMSVYFGLGYGTFDAADLILSSKVTVKPVDMLSFWASVDGSMPNGGTFDSDYAGGALIDFGVGTLGANAYYGAKDLEAQAVLSLTELVKNLTVSDTFEMYTVLTSPDWADQFSLNYAMGNITPYFSATVYNNGSDAVTTQLNAGASFSGIAENTVFKADWKTGADMSKDIGDLELSCAITY